MKQETSLWDEDMVQKQKLVCNREDFIREARLKHGDKFDYTKFIYLKAKSKSEIICPKHGIFNQSPMDHLRSKSGCFSCSRNWSDKKKSSPNPNAGKDKLIYSDKFYERLKSKHPTLEFDLSDYIGSTKGSIKVICPKHGDSLTSPPRNALISGNGCRLCGIGNARSSRTKSYDLSLKEARLIHKHIYSYPESNKDSYINRRTKIGILCSKHGSFTKTMQKHLSGQGCPECAKDKLKASGILKGGYSELYFKDNPEMVDAPGILYYFKVGNMFKIGITSKENVTDRLKSIKSQSKLDTILLDTFKGSLCEVFRLEQRILYYFKSNRVFPKWSTEVFNRDVLDGKLSNLF